MKKICVNLVLLTTIQLMIGANRNESPKPIAVVELFTSQGCSSCPAADKLLSKAIKEANQEGQNVLALSFHVDYWNHLGWSDPFSDRAYTRRQNEYARSLHLQSLYTPQVVVNGTKEMVGSNETALKNALATSLKKVPEAGFESLVAKKTNEGTLTIKYKLSGAYQGTKVNFAVISPTETTTIKRGENRGRTLRSENVVRQFISILPKQSGEVQVSAPDGVRSDYLLYAFVQRVSDHQIIGAARAKLQ